MLTLPFETIKEEFGDWVTRVHCGYSIGEGWNPIMQSLLRLVKYELELRELPLDIFMLGQVKEKFGGLRVYWHLVTEDQVDQAVGDLWDKIDSLVRQAEGIAWKTCEWCGKPGSQVAPRYWTLTLCPECAEKQTKELDVTPEKD